MEADILKTQVNLKNGILHYMDLMFLSGEEFDSFKSIYFDLTQPVVLGVKIPKTTGQEELDNFIKNKTYALKSAGVKDVIYDLGFHEGAALMSSLGQIQEPVTDTDYLFEEGGSHENNR